MPLIDFVSCAIQIAALLGLSLMGTRMALRDRNNLTYKLITAAFGCYLLGAVFYFLHFYITGDWPEGFSPADVAFIGYYFFLLAANLSCIENWGPAQQQAAKKYRWLALAGPAVTILFHIAYILLAGDIVNNIIYLIPLSIWSYFALWPLYTAVQMKSPDQLYYGLIMLALGFELLIFLVSSFGFDTLYYIFTYLQIIGWVGILPAAKSMHNAQFIIHNS